MTGRNASRPAPVSTAITSDSWSRLSWRRTAPIVTGHRVLHPAMARFGQCSRGSSRCPSPLQRTDDPDQRPPRPTSSGLTAAPYRRLGARSPRPCPSLSVAFYRRSRCGVTRPWRSWRARRPSMLLSNGAAVASRSRLTRARPMRHERMVVLFAADGHPRGTPAMLGGVHPTRHGTVRC